MTEKDMDKMLQVLSASISGDILIKKTVGGEIEVQTDLHPVFSLFLIVNVMGMEIDRACSDEAGDLCLDREKIPEIVQTLADQITLSLTKGE